MVGRSAAPGPDTFLGGRPRKNEARGRLEQPRAHSPADRGYFAPPISIAFIAFSTDFFMLRLSERWRGGNSERLFRCSCRNMDAAVGAHSFEATNLRPM